MLGERLRGLFGGKGSTDRFVSEVTMAGAGAVGPLLVRLKLYPGEAQYLGLKVAEGLLRKSTNPGSGRWGVEYCRKMADLAGQEAEGFRRIIEDGLLGEQGDEVRRKFPLIASLAHWMSSYWVQINNGDGLRDISRLTPEQRDEMHRAIEKSILRSWPEEYLREDE